MWELKSHFHREASLSLASGRDADACKNHTSQQYVLYAHVCTYNRVPEHSHIPAVPRSASKPSRLPFPLLVNTLTISGVQFPSCVGVPLDADFGEKEFMSVNSMDQKGFLGK